ncbi:MAG: tetratricopeptide repeat protein [Gammaproteobacteria bacterium]|nr:tetratricopeptide repeat protein [Gammaproteobacteria bacterium]
MQRQVATITGIILLSACSLTTPLSPERLQELGVPPGAQVSPLGNEGGAKSPDHPGMVKVERKAAGYAISMLIDATDENVYFEMDLPEDQKNVEKQEEKKEEPKESVEAKKEPEKKPEEVAKVEEPKEDPVEATKHVVKAQTLFFEKKYEQALGEVDKSLKLIPESPTAHSLKGSIHYKLGEQRLARDSWEKALSLDPNMDDVKLMLRKIEKRP